MRGSTDLGRFIVFALLVAGLAGCAAVREEAAGDAAGDTGGGEATAPSDECRTCHGSAEHPLPGAHAAHLAFVGGAESAACATCHVVPATVDAPGHIDGDGRAEVTFSGFAVAPCAEPAYDAAHSKCYNIYCHGATLNGGTVQAPVWTDEHSIEGCGACHGTPPPPPHFASPNCANCHGETTSDNITLIEGGAHLNGQVD